MLLNCCDAEGRAAAVDNRVVSRLGFTRSDTQRRPDNEPQGSRSSVHNNNFIDPRLRENDSDIDDVTFWATVCKTVRPMLSEVARWCNGKAFWLAISRSRVQILLEATLRNNLRQVVYTYVPLSPSSITWYRPKGGDALRLGR